MSDQTVDDIARTCLRPIRGCATDDQYCEALSRVTAAIEAKRPTAPDHQQKGLNNIEANWVHVEAGAPAPANATHVILATSAYEKLRKRTTPDDGLVMTLRGLAMRMQGRVEAIEDRDGKEGAITGIGVGIGYLLARDLAKNLTRAADVLCDVNALDAVVHELGIEDSDTTPSEAVAKLKAELEDHELNRGRLRLWLEFIQHNCTSPEAREYAGEALNGAHVPEGYDWDERSGRYDSLP